MIFAAPAYLGTSSAGIKEMQQLMIQLAQITGNPSFNPGTPDGNLDAETVWALANVIGKAAKYGLGQVPKIGGTISKVIGYGLSSTGRLAFYGAYGTSESFRKEVDSAILTAVSEVRSFLTKAVSTLSKVQQASGTAAVNRDLVLAPGTFQMKNYPAGAFAVRDPVLNKYRILVPIR